MGEYRRGESRSGTSQLGMLVKQEAGEHLKLDAPERNDSGTRTQLIGPCCSGHEQLSTSYRPDELCRRAAREFEWTHT